MAYEQRDDSGSLFPNKDKKTDKHPNVKGSAKIGGIDYWVDAWTKTDKNGNKWQSLSFKRKDSNGERPATKPRPDQPEDSEVPF